MKIIVAPNPDVPTAPRNFVVFLAGTINNGYTGDWQSDAIAHLGTRTSLYDIGQDTVVYNPRRSDWNPHASSAEIQDQIRWELDRLCAGYTLVHFQTDTLSPITLLELGKLSEIPNASSHVVVSCSQEFYRFDNVKVVCERAGIALFSHYIMALDQLVENFVRQ